MLSGNKSSGNPEVKAAHMPLTIGAFEGKKVIFLLLNSSENSLYLNSLTF